LIFVDVVSNLCFRIWFRAATFKEVFVALLQAQISLSLLFTLRCVSYGPMCGLEFPEDASTLEESNDVTFAQRRTVGQVPFDHYIPDGFDFLLKSILHTKRIRRTQW
jgi:hypothetical protein